MTQVFDDEGTGGSLFPMWWKHTRPGYSLWVTTKAPVSIVHLHICHYVRFVCGLNVCTHVCMYVCAHIYRDMYTHVLTVLSFALPTSAHENRRLPQLLSRVEWLGLHG